MKNFKIIAIILIIFMALFVVNSATTKKVALTLGSWRVDDVEQVGKLLAAFTAKNPGIQIDFKPTNPPEYNAVLRTQLQGGTGPDLFYARSFSVSKQLFEEGFIESLKDMSFLKTNYKPDILTPWSDKGVPYAVPIMAVSHGIYYNVDLFKKMGIKVPTTWEELINVAKTLKEKGIIAFANGSKDEWDMCEIVFQNLAPNFIGGLQGRLAYDKGQRPFNDKYVVAAFQAIKDIAPYLPAGQEAVSYYDSQQLFLQGKAAMFFGGSWDISTFEKEQTDFKWSIFPTPAPAGQKTYVCFHADAGIALNKASKNKAEAKKFLEWLTTTEAAKIIGDEIPGFYPLIKTSIQLKNEHANTFLSFNSKFETDVRWAWPELLAGKPDGYSLMQSGALGVAKGKLTPQQAADALQDGLVQWYAPAKKWKK